MYGFWSPYIKQLKDLNHYYLVIEIMWWLKDISVATWFMMTETTIFLVARKLAQALKMPFDLSWPYIDVGWPYTDMM
jgi:hypothetical protein